MSILAYFKANNNIKSLDYYEYECYKQQQDLTKMFNIRFLSRRGAPLNRIKENHGGLGGGAFEAYCTCCGEWLNEAGYGDLWGFYGNPPSNPNKDYYPVVTSVYYTSINMGGSGVWIDGWDRDLHIPGAINNVGVTYDVYEVNTNVRVASNQKDDGGMLAINHWRGISHKRFDKSKLQLDMSTYVQANNEIINMITNSVTSKYDNGVKLYNEIKGIISSIA